MTRTVALQKRFGEYVGEEVEVAGKGLIDADLTHVTNLSPREKGMTLLEGDRFYTRGENGVSRALSDEMASMRVIEVLLPIIAVVGIAHYFMRERE
jgi:hypothetical protein